MGITISNPGTHLYRIYTDDGGSFSSDFYNTAAFDYFPDDAAVNDAMYFGGFNKYNNLKLYIGTAFAATSVTFNWEYWNGSAWVALTVKDKTNNLTNLGANWIYFQAPSDWATTAVNGKTRYWIRCRISAVDTPTEGGRQSTQTVRCEGRRITITGYTSGTPCDVGDWYAADIGATNGRQLLDDIIDADPDTFSLDNQPSPADDLAIPLKISCTARAGATCDIAGIDAWGNALTENGIDISSGSATTTKRFATVNASGITVNGMTNNDDFDIYQDRWGIIPTYNSKQCEINCRVRLEDGGGSTYFAEEDRAIFFTASPYSRPNVDPVFRSAGTNCHARLGRLVNDANKVTDKGCKVYFSPGSRFNFGGYNVELYSSEFRADTGYIWNFPSGLKMYNNQFQKGCQPASIPSNAIMYNNILVGVAAEQFRGTLEKITIYNAGTAFLALGSSYDDFVGFRTRGITSKQFIVYALTGDWKHINADYEESMWNKINWWWWGNPQSTGKIHRALTFDVKVQDEKENSISGATVTLWDKNGTQVFSLTTDANGEITQQIVSVWTAEQKVEVPVVNETVETDYNPFTIKISKAGYETYKYSFTFKKKVDWTIKLKHSNVCIDQEVMLA